ncbi:hypothetical protein DPEC_G00118360 [Dallia pectoralis]|uniref:Uncharacterized protein n=1 Tax=Dallia pectoralis TaxID=75939 RepID=A0ACC2GVM6_DALPE|nr:hypothetical protein DPEC_G00118360 [Dallia pectoralis]
MAVAPTLTQEGGVAWSLDLQSCSAQLCHGYGQCVKNTVKNTERTCECLLGYRGDFCQETVNGAISVPLTLGVLAFIMGIIIIAAFLASINQRVRRRKAGAMDLMICRENFNGRESPHAQAGFPSDVQPT